MDHDQFLLWNRKLKTHCQMSDVVSMDDIKNFFDFM